MNFEVLKKCHIKRNILVGVIVVLILSAIILTFTRARYRVTESIPLVSGTINFSPYDFNLIAMYLNQDGAMPAGQTKEVPKFGYTLNQEQSTCIINDVEDERITINYFIQTNDEKAYVDFTKMSQSGTKCTLYFDLIPDDQVPTVSMSTSSDDTSITVTVNASDNIGVYYYYYKLDNGEEIRSEDPTYKFEGLTKDETCTISVRVEDAAGNEASATEDVKVGLRAGDVIIDHYNIILTRTNFSSTVTNTTTGTIYKSADESQYDDAGEVYYFAGNPQDNWFYFGGYYWRIIRINGDGSIRLIYNGPGTNQTGDSTMISTAQAFNTAENNNMYVGYMYTSGELHGLTNNSNIKTTLDNWYLNNLASYADYIDGNAGFCGDRTPYSGSGIGIETTYYGAYNRLYTMKTPTFKCADMRDLYTTPGSSKGNRALKVNNNDNSAVPIGLITADEASFAGGVAYSPDNTNYYLCNNYYYWTITPSWHDSLLKDTLIFHVDRNGAFNNSDPTAKYGVRPVINLRSDIQLTGTGTTSDPFKVVGA